MLILNYCSLETLSRVARDTINTHQVFTANVMTEKISCNKEIESDIEAANEEV